MMTQPASPNQFHKKQEFSDGKYTVYSLSDDKGKFRRLTCEKESICILPFDLNEHQQIRNIYLTKYLDYISGKHEYSCMSQTYDPNVYDSHYDALTSIVTQKLNIDDIDIHDKYYLGTVRHGVPFTKEYKCYAVNLTNYSQDPSGFSNFSLENDNRSLSIERVKFNRILKGGISDSLALSCSLLLLSYFSE